MGCFNYVHILTMMRNKLATMDFRLSRASTVEFLVLACGQGGAYGVGSSHMSYLGNTMQQRAWRFVAGTVCLSV